MNNLDLDKIVFLIPSLDPDNKMPEYVRQLIKDGAKQIILVDDGSKKENKHFFDEVKDLKEVKLLIHDINKGKGAALKTGFSYVLNNMQDIKGVVTADADGQHASDDTIACAYKLLETNDVVFGTRNFNEDIVPFKSRNGNKITTIVFKFLYGKLVNDTQTGLRGLPIDFLETCIGLVGDRFEYEIMMLIQIVKEERNIVEVPIKTVYFESNRATHFNTFKDSYKIYKIMFSTFIKFAGSSIISAIIDLSIYSILCNLVFKNIEVRNAILLSTIIARVISSLFNYIMNKQKVFESKFDTKITLVRYYILCCCQMLASWFFVYILFNLININSSFIKIVVDTLLFILSYQLQRRWVFRQ